MIVSQCKARVKGCRKKNKVKGLQKKCNRRCAHTNRSSPANRAQRKPPKASAATARARGGDGRAKPYKTVVL